MVAGFLCPARSLAPRGRAALQANHRIIPEGHSRLPFHRSGALARHPCSTIACTFMWAGYSPILPPPPIPGPYALAPRNRGNLGPIMIMSGTWPSISSCSPPSHFSSGWAAGIKAASRSMPRPSSVLRWQYLVPISIGTRLTIGAFISSAPYALGAAALSGLRTATGRRAGLGALWVVGVFALVDLSPAIAVALGVALTLGIVRRVGLLPPLARVSSEFWVVFLFDLSDPLSRSIFWSMPCFERYGDGGAS